MAGISDHCAPLPSIQNTPCSTARVSCQGRPRLSSRRAGRSTGSTNSHCSSVSSQRPAIPVRRDALSKSSLAEITPQNVYEMGSRVPAPLRNLQLLFADLVDAIGIQHIRQRHDALQLVNIRPVDDR